MLGGFFFSNKKAWLRLAPAVAMRPPKTGSKSTVLSLFNVEIFLLAGVLCEDGRDYQRTSTQNYFSSSFTFFTSCALRKPLLYFKNISRLIRERIVWYNVCFHFVLWHTLILFLQEVKPEDFTKTPADVSTDTNVVPNSAVKTENEAQTYSHKCARVQTATQEPREASIAECRMNLLEHVEALHHQISSRMDLIERELDGNPPVLILVSIPKIWPHKF